MKSVGILVFSLASMLAATSVARASEWRLASAAQATGSIGIAGEVDRIRIAAVEDMTLTVTIAGVKGFIPGVALNNDTVPLDIAPFTKGLGTKKVTISNFPISATMILALEISGPNDTTGAYTITTKRKFAKGAQAVKATITPPANFTSTQSLDVVDDSKLSFSASPVKGSPAIIGAVRLIGPLGPIDLTKFTKTKGTTVSAKNVPVLDAGHYVLELDNTGGAGTMTVQLSAAGPKAAKKKVVEPVVTGSACGDGTGSCLQSAPLAATADVDLNGSTVLLPISPTIRVLDSAKLRLLSTIELSVPDPLVPTQLTARTFDVVDVKRTGGGFLIELDRQIPQTQASSFTSLTLPPVTLHVSAGALWNSTDTSVVTEPITFALPADVGVPLPEFYLAWRPLVAENVAMFSNQIFLSSPPMSSLASKTEPERATEFAGVLAQEVALGIITAGQRDALQWVYDNGTITGFDTTGITGLDDFVTFAGVDLKVIAPTGALRGAVLLCYGSPCQEAVFAVLGRNHTNAAYASIAFGNNAGESVQAFLFADQLNLSFNAFICAGSPMTYLASRMAEKVLQQDLAESKTERIIANAAGALTLAHLLRADPASAVVNDAFVRVENTDLLAFLNSGATTKTVGMGAAPQLITPPRAFVRGGVGSEVIDSFDTWIRIQFPNYFEFSPGFANPTLQTYIASITGAPAANFNFEEPTIDYIDANIVSNLAAAELLPLLKTMQLRLPDETFLAAP